ncbi:MAG: tRNA (adenosine(37)-N6)-threonylcarbamoyltransferase complex transferase subunit TsaD, partial [Flavobacteriaceae bacterium]|nr:tRNA (adenosine(37)-N6)-threonylcarbamoyltransferase complex transferase subunit TsaD [Flavobacteriaceae bacterium]
HTQIVKVSNHFEMEVIGQTLDDAIGEAFDKSAKLLGLPYPGGPLIDNYSKQGNPKAFPFPKPKVGPLDFSFSGLKTSVLYFVKRNVKEDPNFINKNLNDICASLQYTIVDYLMDKIKNAVKQTGIKEVAIGGGVSANSGIRKALKNAEKNFDWKVHIPKLEFCTDNAAMIAIVGELKYKQQLFASNDIVAKARMEL